MQLTGKVALLTGAGSGIGRAAAIMFAEEGARVAALGRTEWKLQETVQLCKGSGQEVMALAADVSQADQMQQAVAKVIERWGRLDIVFANAGILGVLAPVEDITPEEWDRTLAINLKGTFLTVKYAVPHMRKQGGSIVITSSVNGTRQFSGAGHTAYSCSKAAQVAFAKMTALEFARDKIRVNVICPGWVATDVAESAERRDLERIRVPIEFPEGPWPLAGDQARPEQVAQLALFLASDASDHITGTEIWIDGGETLLRG